MMKMMIVIWMRRSMRNDVGTEFVFRVEIRLNYSYVTSQPNWNECYDWNCGVELGIGI